MGFCVARGQRSLPCGASDLATRADGPRRIRSSRRRGQAHDAQVDGSCANPARSRFLAARFRIALVKILSTNIPTIPAPTPKQEYANQPTDDIHDGVIKWRGKVEPRHPIDTANCEGADESGAHYDNDQATGGDPRPDRRVVHEIGRAEHGGIGKMPLVWDLLVASVAVPLSMIPQRKGGVIVDLDHVRQ